MRVRVASAIIIQITAVKGFSGRWSMIACGIAIAGSVALYSIASWPSVASRPMIACMTGWAATMPPPSDDPLMTAQISAMIRIFL
jgi:hypothetical protein